MSNEVSEEILEKRSFWTHNRAKSGHWALTGAVLSATIAFGTHSHVDGAKKFVNMSTPSYMRYESKHTPKSKTLRSLSIISLVGVFGFSIRMGESYFKAWEHKTGRKDDLYHLDRNQS